MCGFQSIGNGACSALAAKDHPKMDDVKNINQYA